MKYGLVFKKQVVPEWHEMYLNYKLLKKLIKPFKMLSKVYLRINYNELAQKNTGKFTITNVTNTDIERLKNFASRFEKLVQYEFQKINTFFEFKLKEDLNRWRLFKINLSILQNLKGNNPLYEDYKQQLQNAFHQFYKEIILMHDYLIVNQEGLRKIIKKFKKFSKPFLFQEKGSDENSSTNSMKARFEIAFTTSYIQKNTHKLQTLRTDIETQYLETFYKKFNRKKGQNELRKISQGRIISQSESFYFGLFLGIALFLIFMICLLAWYGDLDVDDDELFRDVFPMFRGIGAFILYIWLLAWNVYGWTTANINYKLIFGFNYHFSQVSEILKRAAFFSMIFLLMFLWYIILRQKLGKLADVLAFLPKEFTPLVVWLLFLGYLFFPSTKILNPLGRIYSYRLLRDIFFKPFEKIAFRIAWSTDQLVSFVLPLKDLEYTICFYSGNFFNNDHVSYCQSKKRFSSGFIVAFIPLLYRILQCLSNIYYKKSYLGADFFNMLKYFLSLIVVIFSFLTSLYSDSFYLHLWILFAILSTFYSSFWDLKMDWGFLNIGLKNHLLRKTLSYERKSYYYIAMSLNLLFRFGWTMSISPDIVEKIIRPEIFTFFIAFLEMLRRCIWNFFRVEKEHIQNCGIFKAVEDIVLPFENICFEIDMGEMRLFRPNSTNNVAELEHKSSRLYSMERGISKKYLSFEESNQKSFHALRKPFLESKEEGSQRESMRKTDKVISRTSFYEKNISEKKSILDLTKEELMCRAQSHENYEKVKQEVDHFCSEIAQNVEFRFKVLENKV